MKKIFLILFLLFGAVNIAQGYYGGTALSSSALITLSGVSSGSEDLGLFSGSTIPDDSTVKDALQSLESSTESKLSIVVGNQTFSPMLADVNALNALVETPVKGRSYVYSAYHGADPRAASIDKTASTIAFADNDPLPDTITTTDNDFITKGNLAEMRIFITGGLNDGRNYTIASVAAGTITLGGTDAVIAESAGTSITLEAGFNEVCDWEGTAYHCWRNSNGKILVDEFEGGGLILGDSTPDRAGEVGYDDGSLKFYNTTSRTVATTSDTKHFRLSILNPAATIGATPILVPIVPVLDAAITITKITLTCDANPTTELTGDLKWADAFVGLANAAVIETFDSADGVRVDSSIASGAVASGKCLYLSFDAQPDAALKSIVFDIEYHY